ncbi:nitroreductase [Alteromonadaceae bacterium 2753L.S.0a.02]|nr:nitroreductase [Alteromonadaceae bacterium 2753L.S.0a.02]
MTTELTELLLSRRSVPAAEMQEPGPTNEQLEVMLRCAHRVPDHKKLGPWRFIVIKGDARKTYGDLLAKIFKKQNDNASGKLVEFERNRFLRAPLVVAVVCSPVNNEKVPDIEQILSTGAACQNLLLAAASLGFGAQWLTEWYAYDKKFNKKIGLTKAEMIAGYIYIGSSNKKPDERPRPDLDSRIRTLSAD